MCWWCLFFLRLEKLPLPKSRRDGYGLLRALPWNDFQGQPRDEVNGQAPHSRHFRCLVSEIPVHCSPASYWKLPLIVGLPIKGHCTWPFRVDVLIQNDWTWPFYSWFTCQKSWLSSLQTVSLPEGTPSCVKTQAGGPMCFFCVFFFQAPTSNWSFWSNLGKSHLASGSESNVNT